MAAQVPPPPPLFASIVPSFPRIGGQPVRDWIGAAVDNLPGFNGDDLARLLFPDLVGLVDVPSLLVAGLLALALGYWEGGILLRQLRQWQQRQRRTRDSDSSSEAGPATDAAPPLPPRPPLTGIERARYERRRGLGWLALATAGLIWMCGAVNGPTPFQP